jgi:acetoin utilization protein AcuB
MLVRDCMNSDVIAVSPDDTLSRALKLTRSHRIRHLPVVLENGELAGILSDRDIRLAMPSPLTTPDAERADYLERTPVAGVMSREVVTAGAGEPIEDAAKLLFQHRIGALPVVDAAFRLEGILTETDILHAFVRILGVAEPSSRLEIRLADRPGELGRALTIIGESGGLNVVSLVVSSLRQEERKTAILHLATIDPREAIEALEAAGYEVGWPSLENDLRTPSEVRVAG